ncbi:MAG: DUF1330 domain-containing protein [Rhizobacter sp.]|nr:DUF1330 domain-containing protein [Ferruginibacter sp.]
MVTAFTSYEDAIACYHSPEYGAAHKLRLYGVALAEMVIIGDSMIHDQSNNFVKKRNGNRN